MKITKSTRIIIKDDQINPFILSLDPANDKKIEINIVIENNINLTILEENDDKKNNSLDISIEVMKNSNILYIINQNSQIIATNNIKRSVNVKERSCITWIDVQHGSKISKSKILSNLIGEMASVKIYGLFLGNLKQRFLINHKIKHLAINTSSKIITRGILSDSADTEYKSCIQMGKKSEKSKGIQKAEIILLSENAKVSATPELIVKQNDVQCSHGVAIKKPDPGNLYYMNSRGLGRPEAITQTLFAHISIILDELTKEYQKTIISYVKNKF